MILKALEEIEGLSDQSLKCIAESITTLAAELESVPRAATACSAQSIGMRESSVKTIKRDDIAFMPSAVVELM